MARTQLVSIKKEVGWRGKLRERLNNGRWCLSPQDGAGELMSGPSGPAAAAQAPTAAPKQVQFNTQAVVHQAQDPQGQAAKGQGDAGELGAGKRNDGGE